MDPLEAVWSTQEQHAARAVQRFAVEELLRGLRRRQRLRTVALIYVLLAGLGTLGLAGYVAATRLAGDWVSLAVLSLLLIPLFVLLSSRVRAYTEEWREARRLEASVAAATRASLAAVDAELRAARYLQRAQLFTVAVLPLALWREHALGLASSSHLLSQALLFGVMLALAAGVLRYRAVRILQPRRERLRSLLEALKDPIGEGSSAGRASQG
ncbi:hypothetical protein [Hyalangium versicolor]|uniref:hypothetical protein n=1 Tax=Hyalangium versicolor TaxID=2861190 RepID=UPI001CC99A42|nr:hypothetical protein [Hyalangium versicolor]